MNTDSYVYFIRPVGHEGPVKIGCSATPLRRLSQLMSWSPYVLEVAATVPGDRELEQNIHRCFGDLESHREWFRPHPRLTTLITKLQAGVPLREALDLSEHHGPKMSKKALAWAKNPDARLRCVYAHKIGWAAKKIAGRWASPPDAIDAIMRRWSGGYGRFDVVRPTPAEFARLDAFIAKGAAAKAARDKKASAPQPLREAA
jgi:hypothetical protein